jgi:hypothetical protein
MARCEGGDVMNHQGHQQTNPVSAGLEIRQNLGLMNRPQLLHSLHLDDDTPLDQKIQPVVCDRFAAILHVDPALSLTSQTPTAEFNSNRAIVNGLDKTRAKLAVHS